jgi:hypothetical protein
MTLSRPTRTLVKVGIGLALLAGIAVLFVRSLGDTRAEPFTVRAAELEGWSLVTDASAAADQALVALAPPPELPMRLFRQVFSRAGESLTTPTRPGIPLVLAAELGGAAIPAAELAAMAEQAGVGRAPVRPSCMGYRRESKPGATRQLYFVLFDMPAFASFRQALSARVASMGGTGFDPAGLSPVMPLAAQPDFARWMPLAADPASDCMAPVTVE